MGEIKSLFKLTGLIIIMLLGTLMGYAFGEMIMGSAAYTRPMDVIEYRFYFPVAGAVAFMFIGLSITKQ